MFSGYLNQQTTPLPRVRWEVGLRFSLGAHQPEADRLLPSGEVRGSMRSVWQGGIGWLFSI